MSFVNLLVRLLFGVVLVLVLLFILVSIFYGYRDIPVSELATKYGGTSAQFVTIDSLKVHFRDEGVQTDSVPFVLIHGTGSSLHTYDEWTKELTHGRRVIRMDLPGFGLTGPFSDGKYSIKRYVSVIRTLLDIREVERCVLAGNSLGGNIAWSFALQYPEKVKKLILIDASGYPYRSESVPLAFRIAETPILNKIITFITPRFMARKSIENVYFNKSKVTEELVDRYFELTLREGNRQGLVDRMSMERDSAAYLKIPQIQQPTLILWGDHDFLIPVENAYRFQEDLPNDTLVIVTNSGHVPMEEDPQKSLEAVQAFIK
jgi:pimeloyl-ACP methyl ester carboxylesterase